MNEIKVKRMLLGGLTTFLVWLAVEILMEQVMGRVLFGSRIQNLWAGALDLSQWGAFNQILNIVIAVLNSTILIWLYASLRPMYGVGTKTALITSAFGFVFVGSMAINIVNLGLLPSQVMLIEMTFEAIEFPIAMLAGAAVYEGRGDKALVE